MKLKTLAFIAASSAMTLPAFAADYDITEFDTLFGTDISNTATLKYQVNGTDIDETSNTVEFKVDRKVIFSVTDNHTGTDPVVVNAGDNAVTIYTIQNDSNAPISFKLPVPPTGTTYSYVDPTDASNTITVGNGDPAAIIPLVTGDASTPVTVDVTVTLTVPNDADSGDDIFTPLTIVAVEPADSTVIAGGVTAGAPIVATLDSVAWDEDVIQTITIADLLDGTSIKLANDQEFIVSASDIALVKSVAILSDPINGTTNPKAIPGAVVEYTLTITNSGLIAATDVVLSDAVPAVFKFGDAYVETYTLDGADIATTVTTAVDGAGITTVTFPATDIAAATDVDDDTTYGKAIIKFTVKLP